MWDQRFKALQTSYEHVYNMWGTCSFLWKFNYFKYYIIRVMLVIKVFDTCSCYYELHNQIFLKTIQYLMMKLKANRFCTFLNILPVLSQFLLEQFSKWCVITDFVWFIRFLKMVLYCISLYFFFFKMY